MKILGLESSAKSASVAITENGAVLGRSFQNIGLTHSRTLLPMAESLLQNCGLRVADLGAIAVAAGPGSFTGLRIGVSAAKGLAWAAELPCAAVSTLEAMAQNLAYPDGTLIICAMDARRNQVYNALFTVEEGALRRLCPDRAVALADVIADVRQDAREKIVVGDGALLCYNALQEAGVACRLAPEMQRWQDAVGVCLCAEEMARRGHLVSAAELQPTYLRLSQAERERLQREQEKAKANTKPAEQ